MAKYEEKFIVINTKHLGLTAKGIDSRSVVPEVVGFLTALKKVQKVMNIPDNKYYVCNQDEPYAWKIIATILKGEDEKQSPNASKHEVHPLDGQVTKSERSSASGAVAEDAKVKSKVLYDFYNYAMDIHDGIMSEEIITEYLDLEDDSEYYDKSEIDILEEHKKNKARLKQGD